jgi:hypothetical protein
LRIKIRSGRIYELLRLGFYCLLLFLRRLLLGILSLLHVNELKIQLWHRSLLIYLHNGARPTNFGVPTVALHRVEMIILLFQLGGLVAELIRLLKQLEEGALTLIRLLKLIAETLLCQLADLVVIVQVVVVQN